MSLSTEQPGDGSSRTAVPSHGDGPAGAPAPPDSRGDAATIAAATLLNLLVAGGLLAVEGVGIPGTELALRLTARVSFVWFLLGFVATPLQQLQPSRFSAWLIAKRRALGVIFGLSMSMHVGFILRLYALHAPARPPMVNDTDFSIGLPGLVLVALMTLTSFDLLRRLLTERAWKILHRTGIWAVWAIFFLCLVDSVSRKTSDHPLLAYHLFIAALLGAAGLRAAAAQARR